MATTRLMVENEASFQVAGEIMAEYTRDERGRIVSRTGAVAGAGRPREDDAEHIRAIVREVLDPETVAAWQAAMRRKLGRGNSSAAQFVRDTLAGKPSVNANVSIDDNLTRFMAAWNALGEKAKDE